MFLREHSGQAILELALVMALLCIMVFGIIDLGRAFYDLEVVKNLSGEGSNMASRGTSLSTTAATVVADSDLTMSHGCVIVTSVSTGSQAGTYVVTGQAVSSPCAAGTTSKVGCYPPSGGCSAAATLPIYIQTAFSGTPHLNNGSTIYVTEVFYNYSPITPIGGFVQGLVLPSSLYNAAYY
jgi:Flp pilus assembly protein TadG